MNQLLNSGLLLLLSLNALATEPKITGSLGIPLKNSSNVLNPKKPNKIEVQVKTSDKLDLNFDKTTNGKANKLLKDEKSNRVTNGNGQEGNGGGGVYRNGSFMTFGSAGIWVESTPLQDSEVPQLLELANHISSLLPMNPKYKAEYLEALLSHQSRSYYKVKGDHFDPKARAKLFKEYRKATKTNNEFMALYAVTEVATGKTFLLPEFFFLRPTEQMAILFHEAYWLVNPSATYEEVIAAEIAVQKFLESPQSTQTINLLARFLARQSAKNLLLSTWFSDSINQIPNGVQRISDSKFQFSLLSLFGREALKCLAEGGSYCTYLIRKHHQALKLSNPNSAFVNAFTEVMMSASYSSYYDLEHLSSGFLSYPYLDPKIAMRQIRLLRPEDLEKENSIEALDIRDLDTVTCFFTYSHVYHKSSYHRVDQLQCKASVPIKIHFLRAFDKKEVYDHTLNFEFLLSFKPYPEDR